MLTKFPSLGASPRCALGGGLRLAGGRGGKEQRSSRAYESYTYNGLDTRVSKVDSGGTSTYKRAGAGVTAPVLADGFATFTPGVSERRSSTTTYAHSGLKNMEARSGSSQTVTADRQYDAFGQVVSSSGTWNGAFGYAGAFGYQEDGDYGLKLLGHRYYDPSTGRFLTRDPIKDGRNWYGYCENNPVSFADPNGLARIFVGWRETVGGASHTFIFIVDETTGEKWTVSGGPSHYVGGTLIDRSGRHQKGSFEFGKGDEGMNGWGGLELIEDDDKSGAKWFKWLGGYAKRIGDMNNGYQGLGTNSNSFTYTVLKLSGLLKSFLSELGLPYGGPIKDASELSGATKWWFPGFGIEVLVGPQK